MNEWRWYTASSSATSAKVPSVQATPGPEDDPLVVRVDGHQFYWEYIYEDGTAAVDEVVLPVDRPIQLVIDGKDVIHSWWVPELTGKLDAIPGRTNTMNFTIDEAGVYRGQCAELCGAQHAVMYTTVRADIDGTKNSLPCISFRPWIAWPEALRIT